VSTPSSGDASSPPRSDPRDRTLFRVLALLAVLGLAFLVARGCAGTDREVTPDEATEIARSEAAFEPERVQVRFVQQGVPPRGYWAVSFSTVAENGRIDRVQVVLVDAETGEVRET
jgi:hypothetical protein